MSDRPMSSQKVSKATAAVAVVAAVCLSMGVVFAAVNTNHASFLALSPTAVRTAGATRAGVAPVPTIPRSTVRAAAGSQQVQPTSDRQATDASAQVYEAANTEFVNTAVDVESVSQEGSWFSSAVLAFLAPVAAVAGFFAWRSSKKSGYEAVESHPAWAMMALRGRVREKSVFDPLAEPKLETFSFLPPLTDQEIVKQVNYIIRNGWAPMLEFASQATTSDSNSNRIGVTCGYYDNRYWHMWKLPMYGATDGSQVLNEITQARQVYPDAYIRLAAFDNLTQTQISSVVVSRPSTSLKAGAKGNRIPQVTDPFNAAKFETFSYLPALSQDQIARQVQYMTDNNFTPCLEFAPAKLSVVDDTSGVRFTPGTSCGYQDNRYWTMWKLPMFGVQYPQQVLGEIQAVIRSYPECYVRLAGFDSDKQTQVTSMVVHSPEGANMPPPSYGAPVVRDVSVTNPLEGDKYETFSYLPALTEQELAKQINYIISNKWVPCLEFATSENSIVADSNTVRVAVTPGYYDNRYWTMWKLPMFGATDPYQVQREVEECKRAYPEAFVRMAAFDPVQQVQVASFICQKPDPRVAKMAAERKVKGVKHGPARCVSVLDPVDNLKFETFSYLPAMSDQQIVAQVNYIVNQGWTPCLEFSPPEEAWVADTATPRIHGAVCGYQDNRYWVMWKLPMYGCTDGRQVLYEIQEAKKAYPECYMRLVAFDSEKQVQSCGLMVSAPANHSY